MRVYNGIRTHVPLLNALAANSPFWGGHDSGLASTRTVVFRSYPRAAMAPEFADYRHFCDVTRQVVLAAGLDDYTHIWWDVRIHPGLGTIEVRAADAQYDLRRTAALAALVHCLARIEAECDVSSIPAREALAESSFQATRYGLDAKLLTRSGRLPARARGADVGAGRHRRRRDGVPARARPHRGDARRGLRRGRPAPGPSRGRHGCAARVPGERDSSPSTTILEGAAGGVAMESNARETTTGPEGPTEIKPRGWWAILKRTVSEFRDDSLTDWAAALTYYGILAMFPALIALVSILGLVGDSGDAAADRQPDRARPEHRARRGRERDREHHRQPGRGRPGAGRGTRRRPLVRVGLRRRVQPRFQRDLRDRRGAAVLEAEADPDRDHGSDDPAPCAVRHRGPDHGPGRRAGRQAVRRRGSGAHRLGRRQMARDRARGRDDVRRALLGRAQRRAARVPWITPGGVLAVVVWLVASAAFALFVANFGSYNATYGALAGWWSSSCGSGSPTSRSCSERS